MDERDPGVHHQGAARLLPLVIEVLASSNRPGRLLPAVVDLILEVTQADACFLHQWHRESRSLALVAANELYGDMVGKVHLAEGEGLAGWVAQHREAVVLPRDKWSDPRYKYIPELGGDRYTSLVSVPVLGVRGDLVGVLNLHTVDQRDFDRGELDFVWATAAIVGASLDNANLVDRLRRKEAELAALVASTLDAQESERRRVARELHDGVTQILAGLKFRIHASLSADREQAQKSLRAAVDLADRALEESRRAIRDLRPPALDDLGLVAGLEALAERMEEATDLTVTLHCEDGHHFKGPTRITLYRIAQEALHNAVKYSNATLVSVSLSSDPDYYRMAIEDDGIGFDVEKALAVRDHATYGLVSMRERAEIAGGTLRIATQPGQGARIDVRIPR